ncbi:MAG: hypothetical protein QXP41_00525 [Candidatus Nitrosocaldus sp.]
MSIKHYNANDDFIRKLDRSLGILSESIDAYLDVIKNSWKVDVKKLMGYLANAPEDELEDWINALDIGVRDWGLINRYTLNLVQATDRLDNIPKKMRPILMGILDEFDVVRQ